MAVLDATIVNVGLPKIMASFGVGLDKIQWVLTVYIAFNGCNASYVRLAGRQIWL